MVILYIALTLEVFGLLVSILSQLKAKRIVDYTSSTVGTVSKIAKRQSTKDFATYFLTITYTVDGKQYTNRNMRSYGSNCEYNIGQDMTVLYDPNKPRHSHVDGDKNYVNTKMTLLCFILFSITILLIPIIGKVSEQVYWTWICAAVLSLGNVLFIAMRIKDVVNHVSGSVKNLIITAVSMIFVLVMVLILV